MKVAFPQPGRPTDLIPKARAARPPRPRPGSALPTPGAIVQTLLVFALVGFGAQLVDGALGMAYGVTSTSLLLAASINPATASAPEPVL